MRVLTIGEFATFHAGHVRLLKACRTFATEGEVVVALNLEPVGSYEARREVLEACRYVNAVTSNEDPDDPRTIVRKTFPDVLVAEVGDKRYHDMEEWLDSEGVQLVYIANGARVLEGV